MSLVTVKFNSIIQCMMMDWPEIRLTAAINRPQGKETTTSLNCYHVCVEHLAGSNFCFKRRLGSFVRLSW